KAFAIECQTFRMIQAGGKDLEVFDWNQRLRVHRVARATSPCARESHGLVARATGYVRRFAGSGNGFIAAQSSRRQLAPLKGSARIAFMPYTIAVRRWALLNAHQP